MPLIPRASWPADHRDEVVAGVLVAAVVGVLGYASGIGAPGADAVNSASPPTTYPSAPPSASPPAAGASEADTPEADVPGTGSGWQGGGAGGMFPVTDVPGEGSAHDHSSEPGGHAGHPTGPGAPASPSPSPSESQACQDGEVHLVQPLLNGVVGPAKGLLNSLLVPGTPSPSPSSAAAASAPPLCTGLMSGVVSPVVPSAGAEATP
jgi:hypothetical protein